MGFAHGWFRMILGCFFGVIPIFCFGILRIFGGNRKNEENWKIWAKIGLLRRRVGNPRCGVDLRQGMGYHRRSDTEVPKWHPSGYAEAKAYAAS